MISEPYKIFYDAKGNPVAMISESTLQCRWTDIPHLERFYRGELDHKPPKPLPGHHERVEEAAMLQESEAMYAEDGIERMTENKTEDELVYEKTIKMLRSNAFNVQRESDRVDF